MNKTFLTLLTGCIAFVELSADQIFVSGSFTNDTELIAQSEDPGIALFSGGNVGPWPDPSGTTPSASYTQDGELVTVNLAQSQIGAIAPSSAAYPGAYDDLVDKADGLVQAGVAYGTEIGPNGWRINFPGAIDDNGQAWDPSDVGQLQNFFPEQLIEAQRYYRAAITVNPFDSRAYEGFILSLHERIVPLVNSANGANVYASSRARFLFEDPIAEEVRVLEQAVQLYKDAANVFIEASSVLPESSFLDSSAPYVDHAELDDEREKLFQTYANAISNQADMMYKLVKLKHFGDYQDPRSPTFDQNGLLSFIDSQISVLQFQLLIAANFSDLESYASSGISRVESTMSDLLVLRESINLGFITFEIERSDSEVELGANKFGIYDPRYVPFIFEPLLFDHTTSYRTISENAKDIIELSLRLDEQANGAERAFDLNRDQLNTALEEIRVSYESELGILCGQVRSDGEVVPEATYFMLPPDLRVAELEENEVQLINTGSVAQQWETIIATELEVEAAILDLENLLSRIQKKEETAKKVTDSIENLAYIILDNGEKLALLSLKAGEIQAEAQIALARVRAKAAKRGGVFNAVTQVVSGAITAIASGGVSEIKGVSELFTQGDGAFGSGLLSATNTVIQASISAKSAKSEGAILAQMHRQLAQIEAQRDRIRAYESSQIQFQRRDEELYKTEEALHSMLLEAERLRLNILMAEQRLELEERELNNMLGRVEFLLQEYVEATRLINSAENPLNRPDYRLIRDLAASRSEEVFIFAQEWTYLSAKAAQYLINPQNEGNIINQQVEEVLKARTAQQLEILINRIDDSLLDWIQDRGTFNFRTVTVSLKNYVFQNNANAQSLFESQTNELGQIIDSDTAWADFLESQLTEQNGFDHLELVFSLGLERAYSPEDLSVGRRQNPLFTTNSYSEVIMFDTANASGPKGVEVQIDIGEIGLQTDLEPVSVSLIPAGVSYLRTELYDSQNTSGDDIRIWSLEPVRAVVEVNIDNTFGGDPNRQLHERPPANDRWILSITGDSDNNATLLSQIRDIEDIKITFHLRGLSNN